MSGSGTPRFRLLLFVDSRSAAGTVLLRAARRAIEQRPEIELVGVVDTARTQPGRLRLPRALAAELARRVFERDAARPGARKLLPPPWPRGVMRLTAPDVNDHGFVRRVEAELRPDATLALEVAQIFGPRLLAACRNPTNYHDGALPQYRGRGATGWSVYRGERSSGFAFHRMARGVDDGPVLLTDAVAILPGATGHQVEIEKTRLAARRVGEAIDRLAAGDPGRPQEGEARTYTYAEYDRLRTVDDPTSLSFAELERRLRAFELLRLTLAGERWEATSLRRGGRGPLAFTTADGVRAAPSRCAHVPLAAYRPLRRFRPDR